MKPLPANFKPKRLREENKPYLSIKYKEKAYLFKWVKKQDRAYLSKFSKMAESIAQDYEKHLSEKEIEFDTPFTYLERVYVIKERLLWYLEIEKEWRKMLRSADISSVQFALMFGYCSGSSLYNSSNRVTIIKGAIALLRKYDIQIINLRKRQSRF